MIANFVSRLRQGIEPGNTLPQVKCYFELDSMNECRRRLLKLKLVPTRCVCMACIFVVPLCLTFAGCRQTLPDQQYSSAEGGTWEVGGEGGRE